MARRKRMHGKKRRKSSCAPFKDVISMKAEDQHDHDADGNHPEKSNEAVADPDYVKRQMELDKQPSIKQAPGESYKETEGVSNVQKLQSGLTTAEFVEGPIGTIAGGVNALISGGRGIYHAVRGETAEAASNFTDAGLSAAGIVPGLGIAATTAKQAKYLRAAGKYGQARHMDDAVDIVSGGKTNVGDILSPEKKGIKYLGRHEF